MLDANFEAQIHDLPRKSRVDAKVINAVYWGFFTIAVVGIALGVLALWPSEIAIPLYEF